MKHAVIKTNLLLFSFSLLFSCKKSEITEPTPEEVVSTVSTTASSGCEVTVCEDCSFQETIANDTTLYATVLGGTYTNPYSISNMTSAYNSIHGTSVPSVGTTHYYVRFKPQTDAQFNTLDSALDLELYDYPLDRVVIQDGGYWPDAYVGLGQNEYPWLYTVVESNFQFPAGITYENLGSLNIPDDDALLEDKALSLTGNLECDNGSLSAATANRSKESNQNNSNAITSQRIIKPNVPDCGEGYHWDYTLRECVCDCCPPGYHWDISTQNCEQDSPPPPPPTFLYPKGMITFKTYDDYGVIPQSAPLRYTRIVGRRFFKIDKTYTDESGNFQLTKRFPKKVTIIVKFRTSYVRLKGNAPDKFNLKKNIGTYRGNDLRNLNYLFERSTSSNTSASKHQKTKDWLSAVTINTVIETKNFLSSNSLTPLRNDFIIFLSRPDQQTPLYEFIRKSQLGGDSYNVHLQWHTDNVNSMSASKATINIAQQLGIQYLKNVTEASDDGINRYTDYSNSIFQSHQSDYDFTYGYFGSSPNQMVALWQAFAQHFGHTVANQVFGWGENNFVLQGKTWSSSGGISSSLKYLEQFDPNIGLPNDPLNWIPVGLINDLMDTNNEIFPVIDNVSGFTYAEIQAAYYTQPSTMLAFKNALKAIKPTQATAIDQLFTSYVY